MYSDDVNIVTVKQQVKDYNGTTVVTSHISVNSGRNSGLGNK